MRQRCPRLRKPISIKFLRAMGETAFLINANSQIRRSAMWTRNAISAITVSWSITWRAFIANLDEIARLLRGFGR